MLDNEQKENLKKIIITIILFIISILIPKITGIDEKFIHLFLLIPYLYIGGEVLKEAFEKIKEKEPFDECFLMSIATIGAYIMGESHEAVMVMFLYQIGEFFQDIAVSRSKNNVTNLVSLKPTIAFVENENGKTEEKDPKDVKIGDITIVKPGEKIPLDGVIISGESLLNTSILTGEIVPRFVKKGDIVSSGMINQDALLKIKVTKNYNDSTISKIISLIQNAGLKKSKSEKFISNFAKIYTPIVCLLALLVFVVPVVYYLITSHMEPVNPDDIMVPGIMFPKVVQTWFYRALTMLVISCPCSIIISIPLAFFAIIGGVSKKGILVKGSNYIETLSKVKEVLLDKTGTMTKGVFEVVGIHKSQMTEDDILRYAAYAEFYSNHPIAKSIVKKYAKDIDENKIKDVKEISGHGIEAKVEGLDVLVGNEVLMNDYNIAYKECNDIGTIVHVAVDNNYVGHILVNDIVKEESEEAIERLKKMGIVTSMLTGDKRKVAEAVSSSLKIDNIYSELLPNDKLKIVEEKIQKQKKNCKVAFVGDGINDAPALRLSDVGIAMGGIGSDEAIEISDVVIMDDNPIKISSSIKYSKKAMTVIYENIIFSIVIKVLFLILSGMGISHMAFATFADVGVMIICVLNSIRLLLT